MTDRVGEVRHPPVIEAVKADHHALRVRSRAWLRDALTGLPFLACGRGYDEATRTVGLCEGCAGRGGPDEGGDAEYGWCQVEQEWGYVAGDEEQAEHDDAESDGGPAGPGRQYCAAGRGEAVADRRQAAGEGGGVPQSAG